MACANIPHKLWVVNSPEGAFSGSCQNIMIPAETIYKQSPAATAMTFDNPAGTLVSP